MTIYNIEVHSDMNKIILKPIGNKIPVDIENFIYEKIKNKILITSDKKLEYYMLGNQFKPDWIYYYNDDIIHLRYQLYQYIPKKKIRNNECCLICNIC